MQIDETRVDGSPDSFFVGVTPNGQVNLIFKTTTFDWSLCKKIVLSLIRLEQLAVQQVI